MQPAHHKRRLQVTPLTPASCPSPALSPSPAVAAEMAAGAAAQVAAAQADAAAAQQRVFEIRAEAALLVETVEDRAHEVGCWVLSAVCVCGLL